MSIKKLSFEWFSKAMTYLAETMAVELTEIRIASYYESMEKFDQDIIAEVFSKCRDECKFFPQVSEIRDFYYEIYEGLHPIRRIGASRHVTFNKKTGEIEYDKGP